MQFCFLQLPHECCTIVTQAHQLDIFYGAEHIYLENDINNDKIPKA